MSRPLWCTGVDGTGVEGTNFGVLTRGVRGVKGDSYNTGVRFDDAEPMVRVIDDGVAGTDFGAVIPGVRDAKEARVRVKGVGMGAVSGGRSALGISGMGITSA